ncbi:hypothetical protein GGD56_004161 [Rhizobium mongolense]|uniref:Secreted protein n=1 Tax=Rhizobium mongolense TaxID=57676 RepID=A0ABR6IRD2_9HYPH|nr:hypothetical protein [Rhizobium mongolense]MBB4230308.1 hypothetical protein [Rhizobium mongolense]
MSALIVLIFLPVFCRTFYHPYGAWDNFDAILFRSELVHGSSGELLAVRLLRVKRRLFLRCPANAISSSSVAPFSAAIVAPALRSPCIEQ